VTSGVPQGSVLGPVLFLIYINDIDHGLSNWILKFADDAKIFGIVTNIEDSRVMQDNLNKLLKWSEEWQMLFNNDKCKVMHFGKKHNLFSYYLKNHQLISVTQEKDLGILITNDLKSLQQCRQVYSKASKMLG